MSSNILQPEDEEAFEGLRRWIQKRFGIHYSPSQKRLLLTRLRTMLSGTIQDLPGLLHALEANGGSNRALVAQLAQKVTINHTAFFREIEPLEKMETLILPLLSEFGEIRVWSAAAASGQELYTVAILLAELLGYNEYHKRVRLIGTDLSASVLLRAEAGVYTEDDLLKVPALLRNKYFQAASNDGSYTICEELRRVCMFRRLNLTMADDYPFQQKFHITLLRNVLYYFNAQTQAEVLSRIRRATVPDGWLVTSVLDSLQSLGTGWERRDTALYSSTKVVVNDAIPAMSRQSNV